MNAETTVANSGRSMKKFEITARPLPGSVAALASGAMGVACTTAPGWTLSIPSTTTRSPAISPFATTTSLPADAPSSTGRAPTCSPAPTIQTNEPCAPCMTARFGITSELGTLTPSTRARTTRPGRSTSPVLSSMARTPIVPVESSTRGAMNSIGRVGPDLCAARVDDAHDDACPSAQRSRRARAPRRLPAARAPRTGGPPERCASAARCRRRPSRGCLRSAPRDS